MKRTVVRIALLAVIVASYGYHLAQADPVLDIAAVSQIGWWTQRPGAQPVGDGKIEVAHSVRGDESVAALRVLIRGQITKATLVLAETDAPLSSVSPGQLRVCTTEQPWLMIDGGKWADAPTADCGQAVDLTRTADPTGAASWSGDVTKFLAGSRSEVSLMVVPSDKSATPLAANWFITMTAGLSAQGTPDTSPVSTTVTSPPIVTGAGPAAPHLTTAPAPAATTPTTAAVAAPAPTEANQPKRFQVVSTSNPGKPWGKLIFPLLPLAAIMAFGYTYAERFVGTRRATT